MNAIKVFIIPWIPWLLLLQNVQVGNAGLCQQQAKSAFRFHVFGNIDSKNECHKRCCQKKDCRLSIVASGKCFGIQCTNGDLCKLIIEQLVNFEGHRVDKRSVDDDKPFIMTNSSLSLVGQTVNKRSSDEDDSDDSDDDDNGNDSYLNDGDDSGSDNDNSESSLQCSAGNYHKSIIPKRKKGFKFKKLHGRNKNLLDCSNRCCKTDNCVLGFSIGKFCYGVMCSREKNCHSKKDHLPHAKIHISSVKKGFIKKLKPPPTRRQHHRHHHMQPEDSEMATDQLLHKYGDDINNDDPREMDEMRHDILTHKIHHQHHKVDGRNELHDDIQQLNFMKQNSGQIDDDEMQLSNHNNNYESVGPTMQLSHHNNNYESIGPTISEVQRNHIQMLPFDDSKQIETFPNRNIDRETSEVSENSKKTLSKSDEEYFHIPTSKHESSNIAQVNNESKIKEDLILQKIENLEHKIESKNSALTPTEKNTIKVLKKLEKVENENFIKKQQLELKDQKGKSDKKDKTDRKEEIKSTPKETDYSGSGSGEEETQNLSEKEKNIVKKKNVNIHSKHADKMRHTETIKKKKNAKISRKSKIEVKANTEKIKKDQIAHKKEKPVKNKHKQKNHKDVVVSKNVHHEIEAEDKNDGFSGSHEARDEIAKPEKKVLLEKLKSHYSHKEDIFKEFEKFREMYESSGEPEHASHKKEHPGKLETTDEVSGDEGSGKDSPEKEMKLSKKVQKITKPHKMTKPKVQKNKSSFLATTTTTTTTPPVTKHVTTAAPSTSPTTTKITKHTTITQSFKKTTVLPTKLLRHHTKPLPTDSDAVPTLSPPTKLKAQAKLTKGHVKQADVGKTTRRPSKAKKPVTKQRPVKPTKRPMKPTKRPLKPTKKTVKLVHLPSKHIEPTTKATVPTVAVDGLKNHTKKKEKIKQQLVDKKQNKQKNFTKPHNIVVEQNIKDLTQSHKNANKKIPQKIPSLNIAVGDEESADSEPFKDKQLQKHQPKIKLNKNQNHVGDLHPSKPPQLHAAVSRNQPHAKLVPTGSKSLLKIKKPNRIININHATKLSEPTRKPIVHTQKPTRPKAAVTKMHATHKATIATKKLHMFTQHSTQKHVTIPPKQKTVSMTPPAPTILTVPTIVMPKTTLSTQLLKIPTTFPMGQQYDRLKQQINIHQGTPNVFPLPPTAIQNASPQDVNPFVNRYGDLFGNNGKMPMLNDDGMPEAIGQTKLDNFTKNQSPVNNMNMYPYTEKNPTAPMPTIRIATNSAFKFPTVNSLLIPEMFPTAKVMATSGLIHGQGYLKPTSQPVKVQYHSPPAPSEAPHVAIKQDFSPHMGNANTFVAPDIPGNNIKKPNQLNNASISANHNGIHAANKFEKPLLTHNLNIPNAPLSEPHKLIGITLPKPKQKHLLTRPTPKPVPKKQLEKLESVGTHNLQPTKKMNKVNPKKETPAEMVNRILGHKGDMDKNKKDDKHITGHKANNQKNDKELDNFFKNTDVTVSPPGKKAGHIHLANITLAANKKNKMDERLKNLENFFKKADINHAAGNISGKHQPEKPPHEAMLHLIHNSTKNTQPKNITGGVNHGSFDNVPSNPKPHKDIIHIDQGFINQHQHQSDEIKSVKGCNTIGDFKNRIFKSEKVGYMYKVPQPLDIKQCVEHCCQHEHCQIAFLEGQVCNLVECKNQTVCKTLIPTNRNTRLVYFHKSRKQNADSVGAFCQQQLATGIPWTKTKAGTSATRNCPREAVGNAKRHCDDLAHWLQPDFSDCVSTEYAKLEKKVKGLGYSVSSKSLIEEMDDMTTQTIDNSLIFGGDIIKATNALLGVENFLTRNRAENVDHKDLRSVTRIVSNLLDDTNQQEWSHMKQIGNGPNKLMNILDTISLYSANQLPKPMDMKPVITHSILLSVSKIGRKGPKYIFPNYSIPLSNEWTIRKDSIFIPHTVFDNGKPTSVASMSFKTLGYILPHRWNTKKHVTFTDGFVINSNVISSVVQPKPRGPINPPVTIILHHLKEGAGDAKCVFWDFKAGGDSSWSTEGCRVISSNRTTTVCHCNHLTHFAVLSNTNDQRVSSKEQVREHTMAAVWLGIPLTVVFLIGALYTCFAWSKAPRRRHVVLMDKKPVLPEDDIVVTKTVSEKYPGSPDRYLYAANSTPSPSELEWEHAWDFLTNSDFDMFGKKPMQDKICKQLLKHKKLLEERKRVKHMMANDNENETPACNDALNSDSGVNGDSCNSSGTTFDSQGLYFQWKHQDDSEWSKDRIKCLGKGLLDVSNEHTQPASTESSSTTKSGNQALNETVCHLDTFSPLGMSSPHSISFDELTYNNPSTRQNTRNYLQISFDPDVDGHLSSDLSSNYDTMNHSHMGSNSKLNDFDKDENVDSGLELNSSSDLNSNDDNESPKNEMTNFAKVMYADETKIPNDPFEDCTMLIGIYDDAYKTTLFDLVEVDILSPRVSHYEPIQPISEIIFLETNSTEDEHILARSAFLTDNYTKFCLEDCCDLGLSSFFHESVSVELNQLCEEVPQLNKTLSLYDSVSSPVIQVMAEFIQPLSDEHAYNEHVNFMEIFSCPTVSIQKQTVYDKHTTSAIKGLEKSTSSPNANSLCSPLLTSTPLSPRSPSSLLKSPSSWSKSPPLSRSASKSPVLSRAPSLCKIPERTPSFKLKPTSTPPHVSKRVPPSLMSKTTVLPSGCRVLRATKENKQTSTHGSTVRPQTPHMKSYIALRQQCRRNDSQVVRDLLSRSRISRKPPIRKRHYMHDGDGSPKSPLTSPKIERQNKKTENGECNVKEVSFNLSPHTAIIPLADKGMKRSGLQVKSRSSFKCKERVLRNSRRFNQIKNCSLEKTFDRGRRDLADKKVKGRISIQENKYSLEKRTFTGHLRKWQREDLVNLI